MESTEAKMVDPFQAVSSKIFKLVKKGRELFGLFNNHKSIDKIYLFFIFYLEREKREKEKKWTYGCCCKFAQHEYGSNGCEIVLEYHPLSTYC